MVKMREYDGFVTKGHTHGLKKPSRTVASVLGILSLVSLTACSGAATPTVVPQPTATSTVAAPVELPTQAPPVTESTTTPEAQATGTSTPEMVMDDPSTPDEEVATPTTADATPTGPASGSTPTTSSAETDVQATLIEWAIKLSQSEVPAGKVVFTVTNEGTMMHNLTVVDDNGVVAKTRNFSPGQGLQTLEVTLTPGTYTLICSLPGHADRGQRTTLVVK